METEEPEVKKEKTSEEPMEIAEGEKKDKEESEENKDVSKGKMLNLIQANSFTFHFHNLQLFLRSFLKFQCSAKIIPTQLTPH